MVLEAMQGYAYPIKAGWCVVVLFFVLFLFWSFWGFF